ncbi:MAG: PASTA domain-containing protein [Acidobacteriota bacterium]
MSRVFVLACALAGTYALFAFATMRVLIRARDVSVPSFVGLELSAATETSEGLGLSLNVEQDRRFDATIPPGRIAQQDPPAGSAVRHGRSVKVWLSEGARDMLVPSLIGSNDRTAEARLRQDGLDVARIADVRSSDHPADIVIAQDPPPGARSSRVSLLVNRGELASGFVMPDLIGVPAEAALELLRTGGLRVTVVGQQPYPGVPGGFVIRQHPPAGFQITPDQPISIEVSR